MENNTKSDDIDLAENDKTDDTQYIEVEVTRTVERIVYDTVTPVMTPTLVPINDYTPTSAPTNTCTPTQKPANTCTPTQEPANTCTPTQAPTNTCTPTQAPTNTCTPTQTPNPNPTMCPYEDIVEEQLVGHGKFVLDVTNIQQNPELPNGCEGTSVAIVLNYLGIKVDKIDFAVNWIPRGKSRSANPWFEFPGDPRDGTGYGCYMPVVCKAVERYLLEKNIDGYTVEDLSNSVDLNALCDLLEDGYPLMVGANGSNKPTTKVYYWQDENGNSVEWRNNNHFLVLVGYDKDRNKLAFADPQKQEKIIWYDATEWSYHWQERNCQVGRVMPAVDMSETAKWEE